jgi:hypothetical protein
MRISNAFAIILISLVVEQRAAAAAAWLECSRFLTERAPFHEFALNAELGAEAALGGEAPRIDPRDIVAKASDNLTMHGVAHEVIQTPEGHAAIVVLPDRSARTRLNDIAASLWEKHRTQVVFDPEKLLERESRASYRRPNPEEGRDHGVLSMPTASIEAPDDFDMSLLHEIVHSNTIRKLARGDSFAFYGRVYALKAKGAAEGVLPGALVDSKGKEWAAKNYKGYFAFDEIKAYFAQVRAMLHARDAGHFSDDDLKLVRTRAIRGLKLSRQARLFAKAALEGSSNASIEYVVEEGFSHAVLKLTVESARISIHMPLVGSKGPADPANARILDAQLRQLEAGGGEMAEWFLRALTRIDPKLAKKFQ